MGTKVKKDTKSRLICFTSVHDCSSSCSSSRRSCSCLGVVQAGVIVPRCNSQLSSGGCGMQHVLLLVWELTQQVWRHMGNVWDLRGHALLLCHDKGLIGDCLLL